MKKPLLDNKLNHYLIILLKKIRNKEKMKKKFKKKELESLKNLINYLKKKNVLKIC